MPPPPASIPAASMPPPASKRRRLRALRPIGKSEWFIGLLLALARSNGCCLDPTVGARQWRAGGVAGSARIGRMHRQVDGLPQRVAHRVEDDRQDDCDSAEDQHERHHRDVRRRGHDADDEADDQRAEHDHDVDRHRSELEALVATLPTESTRPAAVLLGEPTGEERAAPAAPRAPPTGPSPQHRRQRRTCRGRCPVAHEGHGRRRVESPMRRRRRSLPDFAGCAADSQPCCSSSPRVLLALAAGGWWLQRVAFNPDEQPGGRP